MTTITLTQPLLVSSNNFKSELACKRPHIHRLSEVDSWAPGGPAFLSRYAGRSAQWSPASNFGHWGSLAAICRCLRLVCLGCVARWGWWPLVRQGSSVKHLFVHSRETLLRGSAFTETLTHVVNSSWNDYINILFSLIKKKSSFNLKRLKISSFWQ